MQPVDDHNNQFNKNESSIFSSIFLSIIVIGVLVFSTIVAVKYIKPRSYLKQIFGSKAYEVTKPSKNLPILTEPKETIDIVQIVNLRDMLQNQEFEQLNAVLEEYQNYFKEDQTDEYKVYTAFRTFYLTDSLYEEIFIKLIRVFLSIIDRGTTFVLLISYENRRLNPE